MRSENNKAALLGKLADLFRGMPKMEKAGHNEHQNYDYFSEEQIVGELRPLLVKHELLYTMNIVTCDIRQVQRKNMDTLVTLTTNHKFIDIDSGDELQIGSGGQGMDSGDKAMAKAITGAHKSALSKFLFISEGRDAEADEQTDAGAGHPKAREPAHRPTRDYALHERKSGADADAKDNVLALRRWSVEEKIPEEFIVQCAIKGKMADESAEELEDLIPSTVSRLLALPKKLIASWEDAEKPKKGVKKESREVKREVTRRVAEEDQSQDAGKREPLTAEPPKKILKRLGYDKWGEVPVHFGKNKGVMLEDLETRSLAWYVNKWEPTKYKGKYSEADVLLDAAVCLALEELGDQIDDYEKPWGKEDDSNPY
jgi:hypothetical protein